MNWDETWSNFLLALLSPPVIAWGWAVFHRLVLRWPYGVLPGWFFVALSGVAVGLVGADWVWFGGNAVNVVIAAWLWWRRRKRRRNVLKLAGYKARAALAKLAQRARDGAQPRPVLRPVPGGAR